MHFISNKQDLSNMIFVVQRAISTKNPVPILTGIRFDAFGELLTVTATDLEMGIRCSQPVRVIEEGASVLPSKYIADLIRLLPDLPIIFKDDRANGSVTIKYGDSETSINGFPEDEYPDVEFQVNEGGFLIEENILENALKQILFAVASDDNRSASLTGAMVTVEKDYMEIVSTDLHRLSWCKLPVKNAEGIRENFIIPGKTLNELSKVIGKNDSEIRVVSNENQVMFFVDNISFISRLMNGKFPKYKHVIPKKYTSRIKVKTKYMLEATERASLLKKEEKSSIKLVIDNDLMIISDASVAGQVYEEIPVELTGEPAKIGFNAYYLIELLRIFKSEETEIDFAGSYSPGVFRPLGEKDNFSLILPVRIETE